MKVEVSCNFGSGDDHTSVISTDGVSHDVWFDTLQSSVNISNMGAWVFYEIDRVFHIYRDNYLFPWWTLCSHVQLWLQFVFSADDFLFWRFGNTFLILSVSLVGLEFENDAWAYNFFPLLSVFFLKNLEILTTSLGDFARMGGEITETEASLTISLSFLGILFLFIWGLNWAFTFCLKKKVLLLAIRWFQWDL